MKILSGVFQLRGGQPSLSIDLRAVQENYLVVQAMVGPAVAVSAVVKSDAYGLGLGRLVQPLREAGCISFFVANLDEGRHVRRLLRDVDIIVLSGMRRSEIAAYRSANLVAVCSSPAEVITATTARICYAMNLETGLGRLGLRFDELRSLAHAHLDAPVLVMSHLACADDEGDYRNVLQKDRFVGMCETFVPPIPRSLVASAGVSLGSAYHFDRVRVGSALYGLNNARLDPNPFSPVIRLSASLVDVRNILRGESVGYMGSFVAARPTRLGTVAIGYKHGLAWSAANRHCAEIGGYAAPIVGRVSMEYCAVDLTDVPDGLVRVGTRLDFISSSSPAECMAGSAATVAQEILIRTGIACTRRYRPPSFVVPS